MHLQFAKDERGLSRENAEALRDGRADLGKNRIPVVVVLICCLERAQLSFCLRRDQNWSPLCADVGVLHRVQERETLRVGPEVHVVDRLPRVVPDDDKLPRQQVPLVPVYAIHADG